MGELYRIFETEQFAKDLEKDFSGQQERIERKLHYDVYPQLRQQPFFGRNIKKLRNYQPETWRYRIGNYRFFYTIDEHRRILFMIAADSRQSAY